MGCITWSGQAGMSRKQRLPMMGVCIGQMRCLLRSPGWVRVRMLSERQRHVYDMESVDVTRMGGGILPAASRTRRGMGLLGHDVCTGSRWGLHETDEVTWRL